MILDCKLPELHYVEILSALNAVKQNWGLRLFEENLFTSDGSDSSIYILDTGVDLKHPDLKIKSSINLTNEKDDTDGNGHGTHIAGIIGAQKNRIGVLGLAPESNIHSVKVITSSGRGSVEWLKQGIRYVADLDSKGKKKIINLSLSTENVNEDLKNTIKYAYDKNVLIVAASGNDGKSSVSFPSSMPEVLSVGSINEDYSVSEFSNYGDNLDVLAAGNLINSTYPNNRYAILSGTSMATPLVAAFLARNEDIKSVEKAREVFKNCSLDILEKGKDKRSGYGVIGLCKKPELPLTIKNKIKYHLDQINNLLE